MIALPRQPHALPAQEVLRLLEAQANGLAPAEAAARLERFGPNALPEPPRPGVLALFARQFRSALIYVLLAAAVVSLAMGELSDAGFIAVVLLVNAAVGTWQEYSAERSAQALRGLVAPRARVERGGAIREVDATAVVPGDIVLVESGARVPADLRLLEARNLRVDESLLTGESLPVAKAADAWVPEAAPTAERADMLFAGSIVASGRARGVVVATALETALGRIAASVLGKSPPRPPLIVRMERFTHAIAVGVGIAAVLVGALALARGEPLMTVFVLAVALAVSAIPEGLPVAVTVALAVGMQRMARRNVIVRRLHAVEALGSCTQIASDKTGTLTVNRLTVRRVQVPGCAAWEVTGEGLEPGGSVRVPAGRPELGNALWRLARAAVAASEGALVERDGRWHGEGDAVDVAMRVFALKAGVPEADAPKLADIPYESDQRFSAAEHRFPEGARVSVKGAAQALLPMCAGVDAAAVLEAERALAAQGFRVLAVAGGARAGEGELRREHLCGLELLGLVGLSDPPRPEAAEAVAACRGAGITVSMITGDHPVTALAVGRELGLATGPRDVLTGPEIEAAAAEGDRALDELTARSRVFARIEPQQKLAIVRSMQRNGHFVAVTGDGVNDAPALRAAQVGVAMGASGTDVARETSEIVLADDNFASIVAGVEEGRIAYANIRKVIFLLVSTGAAEIVLFLLAVAAGLPLPLLAVQLLWLNLVTNGIQDVALAFEPAEGGELDRAPRPPRERIFDRLMTQRVLLSALLVGPIAFGAYAWLLHRGLAVEQARNATLLLMVIFENVQAFNSRSETRSVFAHGFLGNRLLVFGTLAAQLLHIGAMYTPGLSGVLGIEPVSPRLWAELLGLALTLLAALEAHKAWRRRRAAPRGDGGR